MDANNRLRAGVAKANLTTKRDDILVNDPLFARVLVLDDGDIRAAIIAIDIIGIGGIWDIPEDFLPKLRARVEQELDIPARHVLVNATHTHPPSDIRLCAPEQQLALTFAAVKEAAATLEPVTFGAGSGHEDRIQINRRLKLKNGKTWTIRHANPCPPEDEVAELGPIDPEIGVLRFDRMDGSTLAVVFNFACHPFNGVPNGGLTADYPGFATKVIEDQLNSNAMALFLQGAAGNIMQALYKDTTRPRDSEPFGTMLGLSTLAAARAISTGPATLRIINEPLELPRKADFNERIAELQAEQERLLQTMRGMSLNFKRFLPLYLQQKMDEEFPANYGYRYRQAELTGHDDLRGIDAQNKQNVAKYLDNIRTMEKLARIQENIALLELHRSLRDNADSPVIHTEVQGIRIGDCVIITSAAEVFVEIGLKLKAASPFEHTFVAAFSNGYIDYGPTADAYACGGYEVVECDLAPEWQSIFEEKAVAILNRL